MGKKQKADWETIKSFADYIFERHMVVKGKLEKIDITIKAIQDDCPHDWYSTGWGSYKEHLKCRLCRKTKTR